MTSHGASVRDPKCAVGRFLVKHTNHWGKTFMIWISGCNNYPIRAKMRTSIGCTPAHKGTSTQLDEIILVSSCLNSSTVEYMYTSFAGWAPDCKLSARAFNLPQGGTGNEMFAHSAASKKCLDAAKERVSFTTPGLCFAIQSLSVPFRVRVKKPRFFYTQMVALVHCAQFFNVDAK